MKKGVYVNKDEKKINVKRLMITVTVAFILMIMSITCIYNSIITEKIKKATNNYSKEIDTLRQNEEEKKKQVEAIKVEIARNKYNPLNAEELEKLENIYKHSDQKRVFLTFDDGPTTQVTPFILDLLKERNIKANFFVLGSMVDTNPSLVKREYDEGHFIANHSYTHKYSEIYQSTDTVFQEYDRANQSIKNAVQNQEFNSLIFRFPGGSYGGYYADLKSEAKQKLKEKGIASIDWNALTNDADGAKTKEAIMENLVETTQDKTSIVLLMHDASDKILTYETLNDVIDYFKNNGYKFETFFDAIDRKVE